MGSVVRIGGSTMMVRPLVSAAWLSRHLFDDGLRVIDVRWSITDPAEGRREYEQDHIPGAVFFDLETELSAPTGPGRHPLPDAYRLAASLGRAGVGDDHHVVVYDDAGGAIAARLWWWLRHVGHHRVSVLDGGFNHWTASGFGTTNSSTFHDAVEFTVRNRRSDTIDRTELFDRLGEIVLLDARAPARYRGEHEPIDPVAGHIPTALNAPFADNLRADGTFKNPEELAARFRSLGIDPDETVVVSCGSGVTACHNILALHLAGFSEAVLYPGSWSDWATAGLPVATGSKPGTLPTRSP